MVREPREEDGTVRQRRPKKEDIERSAPPQRLGTRSEGGRRPVRRNTPGLGNKATKTRGKGKSSRNGRK